ncbi:DUF2690 domain-containing protein [Embleya sp. AB8]|uniref:DUF2690 domain-containing protein n=1 Tax=Embleya sp. AB8 TaxID=3156304 RepID=UPI003C77B0C0
MLVTGLGFTAGAAQATSAEGSAAAACSTSNATSPRRASVEGMNIELRYSTSSRCAWGRITNAVPGDRVWVDHSSDGGRTWNGPLGMTYVQNGSDTHTPAYNDAGYVMRACGAKADDYFACTGWY